MKSIDELLIAWRDETITADELKELERLLGEPGARERLFEEFLETATIAEALKVETAAPKVRDQQQTPAAQFRWWPAVVAAAVMLATGLVYFYATSQVSSDFQIVAGSALVDQKRNGPIGEKSIVTTEGSAPVTIRFADGSTVELAPSSSTMLHKRSVDLNTGKATFQIQKVQDSADVFSVKTSVGSLTVSDSKFSVELQPKGESEMKSAAIVMAVTVLAGSVSVDFNGTNHVLRVGQSQAFGADEAPAVANNDKKPALPDEMKGFNGGLNGHVVSVDKDSIVLKLGLSSKPGEAGLKDKEVVLITKDVKNLPELKAGDQVYGKATEVDGQLIAKAIYKAKAP